MKKTENKVKNIEEIRQSLQKCFEEGKNASQACQYVREIHGEGSLSKATACRWYARFRSGNFDTSDAPRSGRPHTYKVDEILRKVSEDCHISSHDIASELSVHHQTVLNHLKLAGYKKINGKWVQTKLNG